MQNKIHNPLLLILIIILILGGGMFLKKQDQMQSEINNWKHQATAQHKIDSCHCVKIIRANSFFVNDELN